MVYHSGRLISYGLLGFAFGLFGRGLHLIGMQQQLSIFAGIVIIIIVIAPNKLFTGFYVVPVFRMISKIKSSLGNQLRNQSFPSFFIIGLLNGFLPCAMVYSALFGALAMQDIVMGSSFMVFFGLGTVPLMAGITYVNGMVTIAARNKIQKIIPYAMFCIGILFVLRGLSLDIPHLSPALTDLFVKAEPHCK